MDKKGQISIFVIVAIVIVGIVIVFLVFPDINPLGGTSEIVPGKYLSDCIQPEFEKSLAILSSQGGYSDPEAFVRYQGANVAYLCYASGYYQTCVVQQPLLISHFSDELSDMITPVAETCLNNMVSEYERRGFSVTGGEASPIVSLAIDGALVEFDSETTITKGEEVKNFDGFEAKIDSGIYDLLAISTSIISYEATFGDSETRLYSQYYPDLIIDKVKLEDGVKIYKLTDITTDEQFVFATRSVVWPPGYGL